MTAANKVARKSNPQTCRESSNPQKQPANVPRVKQPAKAARKRAVVLFHDSEIFRMY